ncbi:hypothetical protein LRA02_16890 [Lentilactobacillus rapi]|uniref:SpoVT-AbrB domain-containing protein n=3 Tax=Lentilactobacillus rapi TaxID=481723 RepID=A0A512PNP1_9LACO|nr:hypothetical protein LRA02_16890 [Lentilactobacillus rapi]
MKRKVGLTNMITKKIDKWGNSQGIRIPKDMLSKIGINNPVGQSVQVSIENDRIVIQKPDNRSALQKRFENFDVEEYFKKSGSREVDWGEPVGREVF